MNSSYAEAKDEIAVVSTYALCDSNTHTGQWLVDFVTYTSQQIGLTPIVDCATVS